MEWIKTMGLKKFFFTITLLFLLGALLLSVVSFYGCMEIRRLIESPNQVTVETGEDATSYEMQYAEYAGGNWRTTTLTVLQVGLPVLFVLLSLLLADVVFYQVKLKNPLAVLQSSAEHIIKSDLDFTITAQADDELGQLCTAFESMRLQLLRNNQELWRQMEERKRLNAAFSHDLRNPVSVLKGSAKILRNGLTYGNLTSINELDTVSLIEQYVGRIEIYVEAMTNAQKLEEICCNPILLEWETFSMELCDSISILGKIGDFSIEFHRCTTEQSVWLDKFSVYNVTENLVYNSIRYANKRIRVDLICENDYLIVAVSDDGCGFSQKILSKGAEPFLRGENSSEQTEHFGMGLYICRLLCEKHRGTLIIENTEKGAVTTATFSILKP